MNKRPPLSPPHDNPYPRPFPHEVEKGSETRHEISTELAMGGQAVIEGVMMRSPHRVAVAVRKPDGEIAVKSYPYTPLSRRYKLIGLPIIRGAVGMVEALRIGMDALNWSAHQAAPDEVKVEPKDGWKAKLGIAVSLTVATVFGLGMFMLLPYWVAKLVAGADSGQVEFHLIAGLVRVSLLIGYMIVISLFPDIHRVFQYHGSEHKTIFAYEKGVELVPGKVIAQTRFHPRCGTSFLLIVALAAIIFFVIVDSLVVTYIGPYPNVWVRFLVHLPLIPLVAGVSFEFLKFSAQHTGNRLVWWLIQPGLWLQKITTQEPDAGMCEVAILSLKTAMAQPEAGRDARGESEDSPPR